MSERGRRVGENESMWRQINELTPPEEGVMNLVFCECGLLTCTERVSMTAPEYEEVRSSSTTFVVAPGHELPGRRARRLDQRALPRGRERGRGGGRRRQNGPALAELDDASDAVLGFHQLEAPVDLVERDAV